MIQLGSWTEVVESYLGIGIEVEVGVEEDHVDPFHLAAEVGRGWHDWKERYWSLRMKGVFHLVSLGEGRLAQASQVQLDESQETSAGT